MSAIHRIMHDPLLAGHQLLQPLMATIDQVKIEAKKIQNRVENRLFSLILLRETAQRILKITALIALGIITAPVIAPLFVTGCLVKSAALSFGVSPQKRALFVQKLQPNEVNRATVGKVARQWQKLADDKYNCSKNHVFSDAENISCLIAECMEFFDECKDLYDHIYICSDKALQSPQAITLVKECTLRNKYSRILGKCLKISHIATNPKNVRSEVNSKEYTRVEGAGTALISELARSLDENKKIRCIYLEAVPSAVPFYEKLGFEPLDPKVMPPSEEGLIPMRLTKKIHNSLRK